MVRTAVQNRALEDTLSFLQGEGEVAILVRRILSFLPASLTTAYCNIFRTRPTRRWNGGRKSISAWLARRGSSVFFWKVSATPQS